jgi:predicted enzyme related to lactoylglutathione lyase
MGARAWWAALAAAAAMSGAGPAMAGPAPVVFFDIAGPELASQSAFYKAVFGWDVDASGGFAVPVTSPLHANLRVEPSTQGPLTERVIYVGVPDINATLAKIGAHGGKTLFGRMVVPGVVILALFTDPAGNRMGLVELGPDGAPIVPAARP